jgi:hypothetical protein
LLWVGLGGAAAGAVVLATRDEDPAAGTVTFSNARFTQLVIECPDNSVDLPLPFSVLVDVDNRATRQLTIQAVTTVAVITASDFPPEVGVSSTQPSTASPTTVAAESHRARREHAGVRERAGRTGPFQHVERNPLVFDIGRRLPRRDGRPHARGHSLTAGQNRRAVTSWLNTYSPSSPQAIFTSLRAEIVLFWKSPE